MIGPAALGLQGVADAGSDRRAAGDPLDIVVVDRQVLLAEVRPGTDSDGVGLRPYH